MNAKTEGIYKRRNSVGTQEQGPNPEELSSTQLGAKIMKLFEFIMQVKEKEKHFAANATGNLFILS